MMTSDLDYVQKGKMLKEIKSVKY